MLKKSVKQIHKKRPSQNGRAFLACIIFLYYLSLRTIKTHIHIIVHVIILLFAKELSMFLSLFASNIETVFIKASGKGLFRIAVMG
jgi:hypothetical protein